MNKETMTETHRNKWPQSVSIGEDDNQLAINLEISQDRFMSIAQEAHRRGVTLNKIFPALIIALHCTSNDELYIVANCCV